MTTSRPASGIGSSAAAEADRKVPVPTLGAVSSRRPVVLGARCPVQLYAVLGFVRHSEDSNLRRPPLTATAWLRGPSRRPPSPPHLPTSDQLSSSVFQFASWIFASSSRARLASSSASWCSAATSSGVGNAPPSGSNDPGGRGVV